MNTPVFRQDEQGIAIEKIMDDNVPGWRDRRDDYETFEAYCTWIDSCVRGILLHDSTRQDH